MVADLGFNRNYDTTGGFSFHDHHLDSSTQMSAAYNTITFKFDRPTHIDYIDFVQHYNGLYINV